MRLALHVLSSPTHSGLRCYQRTAIHSLFASAANRHGTMRVVWSLFYIVSFPTADPTAAAELARENTTHGDLIASPVVESTATCFHKVVFALNHGTSTVPPPDFVVIADDDAWIHPPRLAQDLGPLVRTAEQTLAMAHEHRRELHISHGTVAPALPASAFSLAWHLVRIFVIQNWLAPC